MDTKKAVKGLAIATGAAAGVFFLTGEAIYEGMLNRKLMLGTKNKNREIEPELLDYYGDPDDAVKPDDWFVASRTPVTSIVMDNGDTTFCHIFKAKEETTKWAIVIHGNSSIPRAMADQARWFYNHGYNVLMPYMRAHGVDEHIYCSMGYKDKDYIVAWAKYICCLDPNAQIVLLGVSMGSATTMLTTGEKLPDNVKCAIADCGYTSCWDEFCAQATVMAHLPGPPFMTAANAVSKLRGNFDFKKCSPIDAVARSKTPTLFIHGDKDTFVPYYMMRPLYEACSADKECLTVPGARHAESNVLNPELYYGKIESFVSKYVV